MVFAVRAVIILFFISSKYFFIFFLLLNKHDRDGPAEIEMEGPNTNEPNTSMALDPGLSAYPMTAGHNEIQAVTEAVRDISIELIRLEDLVDGQSAHFVGDQSALIYNNVESVCRRIRDFPDRLQTLWVQRKAGLDATIKANQDATEFEQEAHGRMVEAYERELELVEDAEKFEVNRGLADEKLKEAVGLLRAVEKREKLVAIRERRVGDLEELDDFKTPMNLGMDGAMDDESEVDIVIGSDSPIAAAEPKGNGCSIASSKGTFGVPDNKPVVNLDRGPNVECSKEEPAFQDFDLGANVTMGSAAAAHAKEYLEVGADCAIEDAADAGAAYDRLIERLNNPGKNGSPVEDREDLAETPAMTPENPPDWGLAFRREESFLDREESLWNREVIVASREKQVLAHARSVSAREHSLCEREHGADRRIWLLERRNWEQGRLIDKLRKDAIQTSGMLELRYEHLDACFKVLSVVNAKAGRPGDTNMARLIKRGCWLVLPRQWEDGGQGVRMLVGERREMER